MCSVSASRNESIYFAEFCFQTLEILIPPQSNIGSVYCKKDRLMFVINFYFFLKWNLDSDLIAVIVFTASVTFE